MDEPEEVQEWLWDDNRPRIVPSLHIDGNPYIDRETLERIHRETVRDYGQGFKREYTFDLRAKTGDEYPDGPAVTVSPWNPAPPQSDEREALQARLYHTLEKAIESNYLFPTHNCLPAFKTRQELIAYYEGVMRSRLTLNAADFGEELPAWLPEWV